MASHSHKPVGCSGLCPKSEMKLTSSLPPAAPNLTRVIEEQSFLKVKEGCAPIEWLASDWKGRGSCVCVWGV